MITNPSVKIVLSCHKEVCFPKNEIYLPVHVGASSSSLNLAGYQRDDEGDNISDRNFTYCELTAQYWAWKHLKTDYIGQCHYRRYFAFEGARKHPNDHAQIEIDSLDPFSISQLGIGDEKVIYNTLNGVDAIIAPTWDVSKTLTPDGFKRNVRDHMVSYGLVTNSDLDKLVAITERLKPEFAKGLTKYLSGKLYRGYNCFVLKREYFEQLCEFEFPILKEFDKSYDYSHMTTTHKRICGYFGEILYSVFIDYLLSNKKIKYKEVPLYFFRSTPACHHFKNEIIDSPSSDQDEHALNIVWRCNAGYLERLSVAMQSLIENIGQDHTYNLTIIHEPDFDFSRFCKLIGNLPSNLTISEAVFPALDCAPVDGNISSEEFQALLPFYLADEINNARADRVKHLLWIDGLSLFADDPYEFVNQCDNPISAIDGIFVEKELNKPPMQWLYHKYHSVTEDYCHLDSTVLFFNLNHSDLMNMDTLLSIYRGACKDLGILNPADVLSDSVSVEFRAILSLMLSRLEAAPLSLKLAFPALSNGDVKVWANEDHVKKWDSVVDSLLFNFEDETDPLRDPANAHAIKFWKYARQSDCYEVLLKILTLQGTPSLKDRLFPPYSRQRVLLGQVKGCIRSLVSR